MKDKDIISREKIRERILKIVRGELKANPEDPKIWYETKEAKERFLRKE
mgnify:CR=1 FL=1